VTLTSKNSDVLRTQDDIKHDRYYQQLLQ